MFKKNKKIILVILALILIVSAFFVGRWSVSNKDKSFMNNKDFAAFGQGFQNGDRNTNKANSLGNNVRGILSSIDGNSLVIKSLDGSSRIILLSASSTISKSQPVSISALVTGDNLIVKGKTNSDGSILAESVEVSKNIGNGNIPQAPNGRK